MAAAKKPAAKKPANRKKTEEKDMRYYTKHVSNRAGEVFKQTEQYYLGPEVELSDGTRVRDAYTVSKNRRKTRYR